MVAARKGGSQVSAPQWVAVVHAKGWPSLYARTPSGAGRGEVPCAGGGMRLADKAESGQSK